MYKRQGFTTTIAHAVDIRGPRGVRGPAGSGSGGSGSTDWEDLTNFDDLNIVGVSNVGAGSALPIVQSDGVKRISAGALASYVQGQLDLGGYLIPVAGTTGQVLAKRTNDDYATEWVDATAGTQGPTLEQIQDNLAGTQASPNTTGFLRAGNGISFTYSCLLYTSPSPRD